MRNKEIIPLNKNINFANLFSRHLGTLGNKTAVDDGHNQLTYSELDSISNIICSELIKGGFSKGDRMMIYTRREVATIAKIFGILKAGGAYVPVDIETPEGRLSYILNDVEPAFVTSEIAQKAGNPDVKILQDDFVKKLVDTKSVLQDIEVDKPEIFPQDLCYIIYTSGSTGKPKGVPITHENFMAFIDSMETVYCMDSNAVCMNTIPFHFDACMEDFYALYQGAYLYITPSFTFPSLLIKIMMEKEITHVATTPSILNLIYNSLLTRKDKIKLPELDTVIMGGDICDKKILDFLFDFNDKVNIINGYGPTEATCDAITYTIKGRSNSAGIFPIGKPLKHIDYVLVTEGGAVTTAKNAKGELLLTGKQVFKGYLNRPDETEKVMTVIDGVQYYKTGDICSIDENNDLMFLGRGNEELKLNGFRVNLNEIKAIINNAEFASNAEVVVVRDSDTNKQVLIAAVEFLGEAGAEKFETLNQMLKVYLPFYMIPNSYVSFAEFPIMPSSKIDKKKIKNIIADHIDLLKRNETFFNFQNGEIVQLSKTESNAV